MNYSWSQLIMDGHQNKGLSFSVTLIESVLGGIANGLSTGCMDSSFKPLPEFPNVPFSWGQVKELFMKTLLEILADL